MARTTKHDWFTIALDILIEQGGDGLTIDTLCARLGVTKGAFYHHFGSADGFKTQLLAYFEEAGTQSIMEEVEEAGGSPLERLHRLLTTTIRYPVSFDVAIRTWAERDAMVREYQARVDARRLAYLTTLWEAIVPEPTTAARNAMLTYVIIVGTEHLQPPLEAEARRQIYHTFLSQFGLI